MKREAKPESEEDFDFFTTVGDNLYPHQADAPTQEELTDMMNLFLNRKHISQLPIYPVRGNHDCYFSGIDVLTNLSKSYPSWKMDTLYYEKEFNIGENGEKFSLLQIDSCFLLCETIGNGPAHRNKTLVLASLDADSRGVYESRCEGDQSFVKGGNEMMKWIDETLEK